MSEQEGSGAFPDIEKCAVLADPAAVEPLEAAPISGLELAQALTRLQAARGERPAASSDAEATATDACRAEEQQSALEPAVASGQEGRSPWGGSHRADDIIASFAAWNRPVQQSAAGSAKPRPPSTKASGTLPSSAGDRRVQGSVPKKCSPAWDARQPRPDEGKGGAAPDLKLVAQARAVMGGLAGRLSRKSRLEEEILQATSVVRTASLAALFHSDQTQR